MAPPGPFTRCGLGCPYRALIGVGVGVVHSSSVNGFDRHVTSVVVAHRTQALNEAMKAVTWLGSWVRSLRPGSSW